MSERVDEWKGALTNVVELWTSTRNSQIVAFEQFINGWTVKRMFFRIQ
jgi:hypothetical protein